MNLFYNINNILIDQFSLIRRTENLDYLKTIAWLPVPKKVLQKKYNKLIQDYNLLLNEKEITENLKKTATQLNMYVRITLQYETLLNCAELFMILPNEGDVFEEFERLYKAEFGQYNPIDAVKKIQKKIEILSAKYIQQLPEQTEAEQTDRDYNFDEFIFNLGIALGFQIDKKNTYVAELPYYIENIIRKLKENGRDK